MYVDTYKYIVFFIAAIFCATDSSEAEPGFAAKQFSLINKRTNMANNLINAHHGIESEPRRRSCCTQNCFNRSLDDMVQLA